MFKMNFSFTFNQQNSEGFGIKITDCNHLDSPSRRFERVSVPGRTGDLIIDEGCFNNLPLNIVGTVSSNQSLNVAKAQIEEWLLNVVGYRPLQFSDGINFEAVCESISISQTTNKFGDISIKFSAYRSNSV